MSCAEIFRSLPELRFLRIFAFNGNDGSDVSSGLVFDESAVEALLKSQHGVRRIQKIELYNTDVCVSMDTMINALQELARLPMHQDNLEEPMLPEVSRWAVWIAIIWLFIGSRRKHSHSSSIRSLSLGNHQGTEPTLCHHQNLFRIKLSDSSRIRRHSPRRFQIPYLWHSVRSQVYDMLINNTSKVAIAGWGYFSTWIIFFNYLII